MELISHCYCYNKDITFPKPSLKILPKIFSISSTSEGLNNIFRSRISKMLEYKRRGSLLVIRRVFISISQLPFLKPSLTLAPKAVLTDWFQDKWLLPVKLVITKVFLDDSEFPNKGSTLFQERRSLTTAVVWFEHMTKY